MQGLYHRCDLLSNCIFDVLKNNRNKQIPPQEVVVICFQIVSLTYWKTTIITMRLWIGLLWFAFKLYLWRIEKQHGAQSPLTSNSCDLLSNCIFDVLKNNYIIEISLWNQLWFAFKLYLWRIEKQPMNETDRW